jgi:hypothetical protein
LQELLVPTATLRQIWVPFLCFHIKYSFIGRYMQPENCFTEIIQNSSSLIFLTTKPHVWSFQKILFFEISNIFCRPDRTSADHLFMCRCLLTQGAHFLFELCVDGPDKKPSAQILAVSAFTFFFRSLSRHDDEEAGPRSVSNENNSK